MARARLYLPITDASGNVYTPIIIRLLEPGTTTEIPETVFSGPTGSGAYDQPFTNPDGVVDVYLDEPRRVRLGVTPPGQNEMWFEDIDIQPEASSIVRAPSPLEITNSPATLGHVLTATSPTSAQWAAPSGGGGGGGGSGAQALTAAEIDDLVNADGLVVGQPILMTDGPTIGVPTKTSPTQILMWPVNANTFSMAVHVYQEFDGLAWPALYNFGTRRFHELRDGQGNQVVFTFAGSADDTLITNQFPWGYGRVRGNRIRLGSLNTPSFLVGWGAAAEAGAFITNNDIAGEWDLGIDPPTCDLSGLTATGPNYCTFEGNTISGSARVLITGALPDGAKFTNNVVRSGFRLNISATNCPSFQIDGCEFFDHFSGGNADDMTIDCDATTVVLDECRFQGENQYGQTTITGTGGMCAGIGWQVIGNTSFTRGGANTFVAVNTTFQGGDYSFYGASGSLSFQESRLIGCDFSRSFFTAATADVTFYRAECVGVSIVQNDGATGGPLEINASRINGGEVVQNTAGAITVMLSQINTGSIRNSGAATRGLQVDTCTLNDATIDQARSVDTGTDTVLGCHAVGSSIMLTGTGGGTGNLTPVNRCNLAMNSTLTLTNPASGNIVSNTTLENNATVNLDAGGSIGQSRFSAGAIFNSGAYGHAQVVIEGGFTKTATGVNLNTLKNAGFDNIV